jgi:hypothetical protein
MEDFLPVVILGSVFIIIVIIWIGARAYVEPPERKMLLRMLGDLADEDFCWDFKGQKLATHRDSGISIEKQVNFERDECGGFSSLYSYTVTIPASDPLVFKHNTKGGRICERVFKLGRRLGQRKIANLTRSRDRKRLEATVAAFERMNSRQKEKGSPHE